MLKNKYEDWMYEMAIGDNDRSYISLIQKLNSREFYSIIIMDDNRAQDGYDLRYIFASENNIPEPVVASEIDIDPVSVLEVMLAMAYRCFTQILDSSSGDNLIPVIFMDMIESLGLKDMDDYNYDEFKVDKAIDILIERQYNPNGSGGLFTVDNPLKDMRDVELWMQCMWYINQKFGCE